MNPYQDLDQYYQYDYPYYENFHEPNYNVEPSCYKNENEITEPEINDGNDENFQVEASENPSVS